MGRQVHLDEEGFTLKLSGLPSFFSFKRNVRIPYKMIKNVKIDYYKAPRWMIRMPGSAIPPFVFEGSYYYRREWYFLSYEHRVPLVIMELNGHSKYSYVIFQIENPIEVASDIRRHLRDL